MNMKLFLLIGALCTVGSLTVLATGEVETAAASGGALQAGTAVEGEPFVDFIYATPAEYTRRTGNSITQYGYPQKQPPPGRPPAPCRGKNGL